MLEVNGLWKTFGGKPALEDVSFKVEKGEIFGLLGHNGAGKSTSLGIILGMVAADRGEVKIGGISVVDDRAKALRKVSAIFRIAGIFRLSERLGKPAPTDELHVPIRCRNGEGCRRTRRTDSENPFES